MGTKTQTHVRDTTIPDYAGENARLRRENAALLALLRETIQKLDEFDWGGVPEYMTLMYDPRTDDDYEITTVRPADVARVIMDIANHLEAEVSTIVTN